MNINKMMYCCILVVAVCLLLMKPLIAEEGIEGNLIKVKWLLALTITLCKTSLDP